MIMRSVVVALAVLAAAKVWTQDHIYRSATEEALLHAYRAKAVDTCQKAPVPDSVATRTDSSRRALSQAWSRPSSLRLVIGNSDIAVNVWEVDNADWAARFKSTHIVLEAGEPTPFARCRYDVMHDRAAVSVL